MDQGLGVLRKAAGVTDACSGNRHAGKSRVALLCVAAAELLSARAPQCPPWTSQDRPLALL